MQQRPVNVQEWEPQDLLANRGQAAAAEQAEKEGPPDTPVGDDEATDALLALAGPRGGAVADGVNPENWKYRLAPQGRPNRPAGNGNGVNGTAGGRPRASSIGGGMAMNSGDELQEEGGEQMLEDPSPTPAMGGRRGPYRRSTLDHMICQVEGCGRELATLSPYHRRYRICEMHFKLDVFVRDGRRQRFCQQCGRCHDLNAFEGSKRSCRNRLNQHNARRRKKNPGGGGTALQHEKADIGAPLPANVPRGSRSGPSLTRPNAIRSTGASGQYPPTPGLQYPIGSDEGVGHTLSRLSQGNMGGPHGGHDGMGFGGHGTSAGQYGPHAGSKRGGGGLAPEAKRRNSGENAGFASWQNHLGSGASSAFSGPRAQLGKGGVSAFAPPGRENDRGRTQSTETSDGQGQDDGLDPGLAAPGMAGHVGTMGGNDSPSPTRHGAVPMSAMYPGMAGMSPGSGPLGPNMPMGFPPGAMGGHPGMWPHPAAMAGGMSNDPATLALQADLISAQMSAMGAPHMGPSMGMAPGAQHAQTVQMLQAQLLRYQYMLHAMVTGAWPSGGPGNPNQLGGMPPVGMDGMGFAMPPMSGGLPGMLPAMDPMMMAMQAPMLVGQHPPVADSGDPPPNAPPAAQTITSPFGSSLPPDPSPPAPVMHGPSPPNAEPAVVKPPPNELHAAVMENMLNMNRANSMPNVGTITSTAPGPRMGPPRPVVPAHAPPPTWPASCPRPGRPSDGAEAVKTEDAGEVAASAEGHADIKGEPGDVKVGSGSITPACGEAGEPATAAFVDGSSLPPLEAVSHLNGGLMTEEVIAAAGETAPPPSDEPSVTGGAVAVGDDAKLPDPASVSEMPSQTAVTGGNSLDSGDRPTDVEQMAMNIYGCMPGNMSPASRQKFEEWVKTAPSLEGSKSGTSQEQHLPL